MASLSLRTNQAAHLSGAYLGFFSMKRLGVFLLPHGWDITPSIKFTGTYFYTMQ